MITCDGAATFAEDDEDEEELVWDDTSPNNCQSADSNLVADDNDTQSVTYYKKRITALEVENATLKSHVKTLAGRVEELEQEGLQRPPRPMVVSTTKVPVTSEDAVPFVSMNSIISESTMRSAVRAGDVIKDADASSDSVSDSDG